MAQVKILLTLALAKLSVADLVAFAYKVADAIAANPGKFAKPNPSTGAVRQAADDMVTAQKDFKAKKLSKADRDAKRVKLEALLHHLADYVVAVAELLPPEDQAALIGTAALTMRQSPSRAKEPFSVTHADTSGAALLRALRRANVKKRGQRIMFHWEVSLDGQTWTEVVHTFESSATVTGLAVGKLHSFRFRTFLNNAYSDYSQVVTLVVL